VNIDLSHTLHQRQLECKLTVSLCQCKWLSHHLGTTIGDQLSYTPFYRPSCTRLIGRRRPRPKPQGRHPRIQNRYLVLVPRCSKIATRYSWSVSFLDRNSQRSERSCPEIPLDRMLGLKFERCVCCVGPMGRRSRYGRFPSSRLIYSGSPENCLSTTLQRLLAGLANCCLLETVARDLDRQVSDKALE
jgi:hypothetical protein